MSNLILKLGLLLKKESFYRKCFRFKWVWYSQKTKYWYNHFLKSCGKENMLMSPYYCTFENIVLGNFVLILDNARIEGVNYYEGVHFHPEIVFHDHVRIQQNLYITCANKIELGANTGIGANVTITDIIHPYENINLPIEKQPITSDPVFIGEDCKIYNNVVILPGTHIGKHCTVGANSVVKGIFPDYSVIVGAPAKIVKRYSFEKEAWLKTDKEGNFIEL